MTPEYPYEEGETIVLGPEIFASKDKRVISWKGVNYVPQGREPPPNPYPSDTRGSNTSQAPTDSLSFFRAVLSYIRHGDASRTGIAYVREKMNG